MLVNSLDKIVGTYFWGVTKEPFVYSNKRYEPKPLIVSPDLFRGYTCPPVCGGCCPRFSLEYLPDEARPYTLHGGESPMWEYLVEFNGLHYAMFHDPQTDHDDHHCRNLDKSTGRCGIHGRQPFHCDFEVLRFTHFEKKTILSTRLFGRGWSFLRVDKERGARCEIIPLDLGGEIKQDIIRRLERLQHWTEYFGLDTHMDGVLEYARSGPHAHSVTFGGDPLVVDTLIVEDLTWPLGP